MCGIIGITSDQPISSEIIKGLSKLEYRGYDSAGLAMIQGGQILEKKTKGKLENLIKKLQSDSIDGLTLALATLDGQLMVFHLIENAHPHSSAKVSVSS